MRCPPHIQITALKKKIQEKKGKIMEQVERQTGVMQ